MPLNAQQFVRIARKLKHTAGYVELGMTKPAAELLDAIQQLGPLEVSADMLRAEIHRLEGRPDEAAACLERASRRLADPETRQAWLTLSQWFRNAGDAKRAIQALGQARGASPVI